MITTMAVAGTSTDSTGRSCSRLTKVLPVRWRRACSTISAHAATIATASQNGKKPLLGPSLPQSYPRRTASKMTRPPSPMSTSAVATSAARILLLEQPPLRHQVAVELFVGLHPLHVLVTRREGRLERAVVHVLLPLRRLRDLLEEAHVPVDGVLRHVGRPEDAAQHEVVDVHAEGFLDGGDLLPLRHRDALGVEHRQRPHALGLPVAGALDRIVDGRVDVLADEVHAHLAAALERHVRELGAVDGLLDLDGDDLVFLRRARAAHLDRKSTRLNSSHVSESRMPSS